MSTAPASHPLTEKINRSFLTCEATADLCGLPQVPADGRSADTEQAPVSKAGRQNSRIRLLPSADYLLLATLQMPLARPATDGIIFSLGSFGFAFILTEWLYLCVCLSLCVYVDVWHYAFYVQTVQVADGSQANYCRLVLP